MRFRLLETNGLTENTIDGLHNAIGSAEFIWHAGPFTGGLTGGEMSGAPVVVDQALVYDFGTQIDLDSIYVWNINQKNNTGRGVKNVELYVSTDEDLTTWTSLGISTLAEASGQDGEAAQEIVLNQTGVHAIKFDILTSQSEQTNEYIGLSKIRFGIDSVPESEANILRPTAVTASSSYSNVAPEVLIDGSGFCFSEVELSDARHGTEKNATGMWYSEDAIISDQELIFDLGDNFDIVGILAWQFCQYLEGVVNLTEHGVDEFDIYYSIDDDDSTWTLYSTENHLTRATGSTSEAAQMINLTASDVRMVKFDIKSNHSGLTTGYVGLSEVRFQLGEATVPEPSTLVLLVFASLSLLVLRRK